ncbi:MAG: helix-turn-helix domain-containing protein [Actinobacteria bacterium]|nr:helix-turn-helix domain-containing protein [Actinomycetota bacterium]
MTRRAEGWAAEITRCVGRAVRDLRREREMSGEDLVKALADVGVPMTRNSLTNLEADRRQSIGVHEVYALAAVLGVAPIALLVPDYGAEVEMLPGHPTEGIPRVTDGTRLALWIAGQHLPGAAHLHDNDEQTYAESAEPIDNLILHAELIRDVQVAERTRQGPAGDQLYMQALRSLLDLRASMAERHGITAPPLPPDLDYIETQYPTRPTTTEGKN